MFIVMPPIKLPASAAASMDRRSCATRFASCCCVVGVIVGHNLGAKITCRPGNSGSNGRISCVARRLSEPLSQGGEPCAHVFRQGKQGAYRHQGEITIRPGLTSRNVEVCCLLRYPAMPTIGKNHPDPANAPNQPARGDFERLTEQRMDGVDDPDSGYQSFRYCGIAPCSATRLMPMPFSTASSTTPIASISPATACGEPDRDQP